jgi:hypothetical protein
LSIVPSVGGHGKPTDFRLTTRLGEAGMAFQRRDIFFIPPEFRSLPEADRVLRCEAEFQAAIEREKVISRSSGARVHWISPELAGAQRRLKEAQDAFDAAAGLPKPAILTQRVKEVVEELFPASQHVEVFEMLVKKCGRTIPFQRDATPLALEPYRLAVLRGSKGDMAELKKWIEAANIVGRDIL